MSPRIAAALRDHGGRSVREHLILTAERMMAAHGSAGLTVRAIAQEAGVAAGVLYNHFADKEELLAEALHAHVRAVESVLGALPAPGSGAVAANLRVHVDYGMALHQAILPAFTGFAAQPAVLAKFADIDQSAVSWRDRLSDYLRAEQEAGRLAPGADTDTAAALIVGICHEAVLSALLAPGVDPPPAPAADAVVATLLDGIRA